MTSIGKKQIVALTGVLLVLFIISHLAGNLLIYAGPAVYNGYSHALHYFVPLLRFMEYGLLGVFIIHIWFTALVVIENIKARGGVGRYAVDRAVGKRSFATRIMPWTGTYILVFVLWHLYDFTFVDPAGPRSYIHGKSWGLYGVVVNAFKDPMHGALYVIGMCFLAFHLAHGVESALQTWGLKNARWANAVNTASRLFAWMVGVGFSSIPVYVYFVLR